MLIYLAIYNGKTCCQRLHGRIHAFFDKHVPNLDLSVLSVGSESMSFYSERI